MAEIGAAAGIVGSGIYRHFPSKVDLLVALFDEAGASLEMTAREIIERAAGPRLALDALVAAHIDFALLQRSLNKVYVREIYRLPPEQRRRVQRHQRTYVLEWVDTLRELRPSLSEEAARVVVLAAIGAIHSVLYSEYPPREESIRPILKEAALAVLLTDAPNRRVDRSGEHVARGASGL